MEFEIFREKVEIAGKEYELRPLSGRFIGKFWSVMNKVAPFFEQKGDKEGDEEVKMNLKRVAEMLDEETAEKLHLLVFETLKASYPEQAKKDADVLDQLASKYLIEFLPPILELNLPSQPETK